MTEGKKKATMITRSMIANAIDKVQFPAGTKEVYFQFEKQDQLLAMHFITETEETFTIIEDLYK